MVKRIKRFYIMLKNIYNINYLKLSFLLLIYTIKYIFHTTFIIFTIRTTNTNVRIIVTMLTKTKIIASLKKQNNFL